MMKLSLSKGTVAMIVALHHWVSHLAVSHIGWLPSIHAGCRPWRTLRGIAGESVDHLNSGTSFFFFLMRTVLNGQTGCWASGSRSAYS
jgi:hypothetical protein